MEKNSKIRKQEYAPEIKGNLNLESKRSHCVLSKHHPEYSKQRYIIVKLMDLKSKQRVVCWYKQTCQVALKGKRKGFSIETVNAK